MCADAELDVGLADVEAVLSASDVTLEEPFAAMSRLGLAMVQTTEDF